MVLGVGGGIAAYKACELLRRLRAAGADVTVVPTASALKFVGAATWEALSGHPVATDVFTDIPGVAHVATGQRADLVVIAPATADLLARAATGRADDLLTATLLVTRAPVLMAPAMHTEMWTHPATVANVATLRARGVVVIDPAVGRLTGADSGAGRLPDAEHIEALAELLLRTAGALPRDLAGRRVVDLRRRHPRAARPGPLPGQPVVRPAGIRAGPGGRGPRRRRSPWSRPTSSLPDPPGVTVVPVSDARELQRAMTEAHARRRRGGDGRGGRRFPAGRRGRDQDQEAGRSGAGTAGAGAEPGHPGRPRRARARRPAVVVGFAAETGDEHGSVLDYARDKLARKGCDLLVVNRVDGGRAFEVADNAGVILAADGTEPVQIPLGPKTVLAAAVCDAIAALDCGTAREPSAMTGSRPLTA